MKFVGISYEEDIRWFVMRMRCCCVGRINFLCGFGWIVKIVLWFEWGEG